MRYSRRSNDPGFQLFGYSPPNKTGDKIRVKRRVRKWSDSSYPHPSRGLSRSLSSSPTCGPVGNFRHLKSMEREKPLGKVGQGSCNQDVGRK
ncbi:hypothetical protein CEXT_681211 [Caerostris extrusa]|uniref:Uncharacterized protein n=1 Tax=Caerostris extrusa TaxID=172846 RepID=A0AAV4RFT7_CAEEX|nr:hypothetical protein CEXT_681211 [Caerostris extrusa]